MSLDIVKETATVVPDGSHEGEITNVMLRETDKGDEKYSYLCVEISMNDIKKQDDTPVRLEMSAPSRLTVTPEGKPNSNLAHMLVGLGYVLENVNSINPDEMLAELKGKKVSFMTLNETSERGTFARIIEKSVKVL